MGSDLPPDQEEVRRLLADARHQDAIPPEVVARLDDTLQALVSERESEAAESSHRAGEEAAGTDAPQTAEADVVPLRREPRRPGRGPRVLLAAAAVAAIGWGGVQLVTSGEEDGDASSVATDAGARDSAREAEGAAPHASESGAAEDLTGLLERVDVPGLRFADPDDVKAFAPPSGSPEGLIAKKQRGALGSARTRCGPADPADGALLVAAEYRGHPAVTAFGPPESDGTRAVAVYVCDGDRPGQPTRSTTVAAGE